MVLPVLVLMRTPLPGLVMLRKWIREIGEHLPFIPAQHVLLVIEATEEVCEEKCEEGNNFCDRGDDKHAAKKHKNL